MKYRMIGIDLDGTLLAPGAKVSERNRAAIAAAQDAGVLVVPCTGRGWREARLATRHLDNLSWGVYVTGASIAEVNTGRCVDFSVIEPHLVRDLVGLLQDEPEAVLLYREHNRAGHEYLVTGRGKKTDNSDWWFRVTGSVVREKPELDDDDLHHTLRVGMVANGPRLPELAQKVRKTLGDRVLVHAFPAVRRDDINETVFVLEVFAAGVDKWRGLSWIAREHGIAPGEVAAIGDEINDVAMLEAAACGVAMGNAVPEALAVADRVTDSCEDDGVAAAIDHLLAGRW